MATEVERARPNTDVCSKYSFFCLAVQLSLMYCSAMHSGYRVLKMEGNQELSVTCALDSEGELGYGIDWLQLGTEQRALASCSFYNHELQLWSVK